MNRICLASGHSIGDLQSYLVASKATLNADTSSPLELSAVPGGLMYQTLSANSIHPALAEAVVAGSNECSVGAQRHDVVGILTARGVDAAHMVPSERRAGPFPQ